MTDGCEMMLGEGESLPFFTNARGVLSVDGDLVRIRIYSPDSRLLLADIGLSPPRARAIGARFIAGANRIDPIGAVTVVEGRAP